MTQSPQQSTPPASGASGTSGTPESPAITTIPLAPSPSRSRLWSFLALLCLVPIPSLAILNAGVFQLGRVGQVYFTFGKFWILFFPAAWMFLADHAKPSWSPPRRGGLIPGSALGLAIAACILLAFVAIRPRVNLAGVHAMAARFHMTSKIIFLLGAAYWCVINSVLEEYVWRWFVYTKIVDLLSPPKAGPAQGALPATPAVSPRAAAEQWACVLSALLFTTHHAILLGAFLAWPLALLGTLGVFIGGLCWSSLYRRYASIWPGFVSHLLADVAIFVGVWPLIFS